LRVLLVSSNPVDKSFFDGVAKSAGMPLVLLPNADKACDELLRDPNALVVVDISTPDQYKAFEKAISEKIGLYSAILNPNTLFFVASHSFHETPYIVRSDLLGHFIQRTFTPDNQSLIARLFLMAGSDKAFGLEKYFSSEIRTQRIQITKSMQKRVIVESLKDHLLKIGFKPRIAMVIASAADELIMNAIFDAPVDGMGKQLHAQTPRSAALELIEKNIVELKLAFDGKILGISVIDKYGSLDKKKLLSQHLGRSYESHQYEMRTSTAGAGLGLAQVYRNCGGIIFATEAGERTEMNIFFRKTDSFRDFKSQFRFLSTLMYFS
jgi:hypothetical protein